MHGKKSSFVKEKVIVGIHQAIYFLDRFVARVKVSLPENCLKA
jgi:hypothetical protein